MKRYLLFVLIMLAAHLSKADDVIDSLRAELAKAKHDTTRILILLNMVTSEYDEQKWPAYNEEALALAEKLVSSTHPRTRYFAKKSVADALNNKG